MSIEAINEQLLRAIGVGVALVDLGTLELRYRNDTFAGWFIEAHGGSIRYEASKTPGAVFNVILPTANG